MKLKNNFFLKFGLKTHYSFLIININDFSFEAAVLSNKEGNETKIKVLEKGKFFSKEQPLKNESVKNLNKQFEAAVKKIMERAALEEKIIDFCFIFFGAPWYNAKTHSVRVRKEESFIFKESDFDNILKNENSGFVLNLKKSETGEDFKFIEGEIMKVFLNGYETNSPFNKKIKNLELYIYLSGLLKEIFDKAERQARINLINCRLIFKTKPSLLFSVLKDIFDFKKGAIMADIQEETTELILIKNGYIEEMLTLSKGANFVSKRLASGLNTAFDEAETLFLRYKNNDIEPNLKQKIGNILNQAARDWQTTFLAALAEIAANNFMPPNILYFSAKPVLKEFFEFKNAEFYKEGAAIKEIFLKEIAEKILNKKIDFEGPPLLVLEAAFIEKYFFIEK